MRKPYSKLTALFLIFLLLMAFSSGLAARVLPEQWLTGDAQLGAAAFDQDSPAIAYGDGQYLVVWSDRRADPLGVAYLEIETSRDIYGMRLDASGTPIDTLPFVITQAAAGQTNPQVAWNGENWLVAWEDYGVSGTGYYYSSYVRGARVAPDGSVLDDPALTLYATGSSSSLMFAIASDNNNWAIIVQGTSSGENDIVGRRLSAQGEILDVAPKLLVAAEYYLRFDLRLTGNSGGYLMSWEDLNDLQAMRVSANLEPVDGQVITLAENNAGSAQLGAGANDYFAVWTATRPDYTAGVFGTRIDANGQVLDPGGIDVSRGSTPDSYGYLPQVAWDGSQWWVSWTHQGLSLARVTVTGDLLDPGGIPIPSAFAGPVAVSDGSSLVMATTQNDSAVAQSADIHALALTPAFTVLGEHLLSSGAPAQTHADAIFGGAGWALTYRSTLSREWRILFQVLNADGSPLMAEPLLLDSGLPLTGPSAPAVAWNGSIFLVAWNHLDGGGIFAQRFAADGSPLDAAPFLVMRGGGADVAALGDVFLVVGVDQTLSSEFIQPFAMRVRGSDGALLDAQPTLLGASFSSRAAVTALGDRWLVAWQRNYTHDDVRAELNAAFVEADGSAGGAFLVDYLSTTSQYQGPHFASRGDAALMVWEDERISSVETEIVAQLISADGSLGNQLTVTELAGNQMRTDVAWDDNQFIVVYQDQRSRTSELDMLDVRTDVYASRIDAAGNLIDPAGFAFAITPGGEFHPTIAANGGEVLIAASSVVTEAPYTAYRIGYTLLGEKLNQWPVAVVNATPTSGTTPLTVQFDNSGSYDPDGYIANYSWDFGDGGQSSEASPSYTYVSAGYHVAELRLTDNQGVSTSNSVLVNAAAPNQAPVAVASADVTNGPAPLSVVFSASGSYDPDGSIGNIYWSFSDGGDYWGSPAYHTFSSEGTYLVTLTVYDNSGATGTDTLTITVGATNAPPVAVAQASPLQGEAPLQVQFDASGSFDTDGSIASYTWDFGDGATAEGIAPLHTYAQAGSYTVVLTVADNGGAIASDTLAIQVYAGACISDCLRVDALDLSARVRRTTAKVTATAIIRDEQGALLRDVAVTVEWTLPNGTPLTQTAVTNRRGQARFTAASTLGTYLIRVQELALNGYSFDPDNSILSATITP